MDIGKLVLIAIIIIIINITKTSYNVVQQEEYEYISNYFRFPLFGIYTDIPSIIE